MGLADGGGRSTMVGINPAGLAQVISQATAARDDLYAATNALRGALGGVGLPTYDANSIGALADWLDQQIPSLQRRHALAEAAGTLLPWANHTGLVWLDEALIARFASPADAKAAGQATAQQLIRGLDHGEIDPQAVADLEALNGDPHFALAFVQEMGPVRLTELAGLLSDQRQRLGESADLYGLDFETKRADLESRSLALLTAVDKTFAAATRGNTPDTALPAQFVDDLFSELPQSGFGLAHLLRFGDYDTAFLGKVGDRLYRHDREFEGGRGYWQSASERAHGMWAATVGGDDIGFFDPMVGLMTAMSRNPVAAQSLLGDDEKLAYFNHDRGWSSDEGKAYGHALEAATTVFRYSIGEGSPGYTSALIASKLIHDIAAHDHKGHMYEHLRGSIGNILASYIADVDAAAVGGYDLGAGVNTDPFTDMPQPQPYGAVFSKADLHKVMQTAFKDPNAFQVVSAAGSAYAAIYFDQMAAKVAAGADPALIRTGAPYP